MLTLDTHVLVFAMAGELTARERRTLEADTWSISAITLWELSTLVRLGRLEFDLDAPEVTRLLARLHTWPLTLEVCRAIERLDFRSDPADEIIAATSVVHRAPLVTRDRRLRRSKVVPLARL